MNFWLCLGKTGPETFKIMKIMSKWLIYLRHGRVA